MILISRLFFSFLLAVLFSSSSSAKNRPRVLFANSPTIPEQIHIAYGESSDQMVIMWVTWNTTSGSKVTYSDTQKLTIGNSIDSDLHFVTNAAEIDTTGTETVFEDGGLFHRKYYVHHVILSGLGSNTSYTYKCGNDGFEWSAEYTFRTHPDDQVWSPRIAVYGDMGVENEHILSLLLKDVDAGRIDHILHIGDMAYDMADDEGRMGDAFMNMIQPLAARIPYMVAVGNHEHAFNFSNYKRIFAMPRADGDGESLFWSYNVGHAHIVAYSTEIYYFVDYGWRLIQRQYDWLRLDLERANHPPTRQLYPWIIAVGHRPMYCSNSQDKDHCHIIENFARVGVPFHSDSGSTYLFPPEELLYEQGVDLAIWAHEHDYERFWPVYNRRVCNGTDDPKNPYKNPRAPVHLLTGAAGNKEDVDVFRIRYPWTAVQSSDYSYTRLTIESASLMHLEQVSANQDGKVIDEFWIDKGDHDPSSYNCN